MCEKIFKHIKSVEFRSFKHRYMFGFCFFLNTLWHSDIFSNRSFSMSSGNAKKMIRDELILLGTKPVNVNITHILALKIWRFVATSRVYNPSLCRCFRGLFASIVGFLYTWMGLLNYFQRTLLDWMHWQCKISMKSLDVFKRKNGLTSARISSISSSTLFALMSTIVSRTLFSGQLHDYKIKINGFLLQYSTFPLNFTLFNSSSRSFTMLTTVSNSAKFHDVFTLSLYLSKIWLYHKKRVDAPLHGVI